jgi:CubicO group peptidase (beta-lactamase class C family)
LATASDFAVLEDVAREARERWNVPGIAVGLLRDGRVETFADGVASLETGAPVTAEARFRVASISKPFTASLALTLVQDGLLDLDEPLRGRWTARALLSHSAGLASEWPEPLAGTPDDDDALERLLASQDPAPGPVGTEGVFSYCNAGFWIVAAEIARRTGQTFEAAMQERVLDPLGLARTGFEDGGADAAEGHSQVTPGADEHRVERTAYPRVRRSSGGLHSTVGDLLRFAAHHLGGPGPLSPGSIRAMQEPQVSFFGGEYAIGWLVREANGRRVVEHAGSALGYQTVLSLVPEEGLALAVLTNSSRGAAAYAEVQRALGLGEVEPEEAPIPPGELAAFAGRFRGQHDEVVVRAADGGLQLDYVGADAFTGEKRPFPPVAAPYVGHGVFQVREGEERGTAAEFLEDGRLLRLGWSLFERVPE